MLTLHLEKTLGEFSVNVAFASESRATALFGPSGAGKTSLINMIAGLLRPDRGRVEIDGEVLFDSAARIDVPPWRRRIGYVFQEGRLFPHFTVRHNLEYGRWMGGHKFDPSAFQHVVELLDIGHLLDRRPGKLSGGERQRIAVGRALLMQPRLLLLDEPLASLDAPRKRDILPYLERLRDEARMPMIYVSHNATELKLIASHVVWLDGGRVATTGGVERLDAAQVDMLA
ncbi:MAG TPA: molybdenum ABC transporter ATP-binding protein [Pseudolabrys sp.]|jgi:molybdate transport system ATP-binding protein|nr:molybdenum ABC transporter ATP-binding protein [Pseudolabrys sp.]